ncbi:MAG: SDR family NAD(P)-dependent oxidoreductase [Alphaproteobacteria bacterium]|nr:SDR family NAD(P)-dependent oxidoreductase [Alphaproteobacteria bacterium]
MATNTLAYLPKTVLITGATGDFGRAFAHKFKKAGCRLVLAGRNAEKLEALEAELGDETYVGIAEMSDTPSIKTFIQNIPDDFKDIDLLINNAGLALGLDPAPKASLDDWANMIDVNAKGLVAMSRLVLEGMAARKRGHIVNIGSTAGNYPYPGGNVYCASKAFVKMFSLAIRADLAGTNIRVTNIEPGMVETQFSAVRFKGDSAKAASVYADTKPLTPDDIAESVFWAATLPPHVNINRIEVMPTVQSFGPLPVERFA